MFGKLQMTITHFTLSMINTFLIIISFCSIFNFIAMICSEITVSTTISILVFIAMFIAEASLGYTANKSKYITYSYWENGVEYIINQEEDSNYPGDQKVKMAKTLYLFIPEGQANEIANGTRENLCIMQIYSIMLISIFNIVGIYLFSRKELK